MNLFYEIPESLRARKHRLLTNCHYLYDSGGGETESKSSLDPAQQEMLRAAAGQVTPRVSAGTGATAYSGQLTVEPDSRALEIMDRYLDNPELLNQQDLQALDTLIKGEPAYKFDAADWANKWKETYAAPLAGAWSQYTMPAIAESMNVTPGSFFATETANVVGNKANEFFQTTIAPSLFTTMSEQMALSAQSADNARNASLNALNFKSTLPSLQTGLATSLSDWKANYTRLNQQNLYQEAQRLMPENSPWLQMALNNSTKATVDTVVTQDNDLLGSAVQAAGMGLGAYAALA